MAYCNKTALIKYSVFLDTTSCQMVGTYRRFGRAICLHIQGRIIREHWHQCTILGFLRWYQCTILSFLRNSLQKGALFNC